MTLPHPVFPLLATLAALAISSPALGQDIDAAAINIGETAFTPSVRLDFANVTNVFRSENDEVDVQRLTVSPAVLWTANRRLLDIGAEYKGEFAVGTDEDPGFNDSELRIFGRADFSSRNRTSAELSIAADHSEITEGVLSNATSADGLDVANFIRLRANINHRFGSFQARGNLFGGLRAQSTDYTNRPEFTDGDDFTTLGGFGVFGLRVSPDTRALIGVRLTDFAFDNEIRDRTDVSPFIGVVFSATGKLSGEFRIGATQTIFDSSTRDDETSAFASADLTYQPRNFSTFNLIFSREIDNATGSAVDLDSPIQTLFELEWRNEWSTRITTSLAVEIENIDAGCPRASENTIEPSFELTYALRRFISMGFLASNESRTVSLCDDIDAEFLEEFDTTYAGIFVRGSL